MVALCLFSYAISTSIVYEIISPFCVSIIVYWLAIQMPLISYNNKNGDYSYGLYLFHFPIVQTLISLGLLYYINARLFAIICLSISLIVSVISWRLVEKPSLKYAHRK
jgi:type IV secretory pathway TrbL component